MKVWLFGINDISSSLAATAQFLHFIILGLHIWPLPTLSLQVLGRKIQDKNELFKINLILVLSSVYHHQFTCREQRNQNYHRLKIALLCTQTLLTLILLTVTIRSIEVMKYFLVELLDVLQVLNEKCSEARTVLEVVIVSRGGGEAQY